MNYWNQPKPTILTLSCLVPTGCWSEQVKNTVSFSGTQWKFLLSCLLLAIEWWFDSSLGRSSCCPFIRCKWNISSSFVSFSLRYRRKLCEGRRGFGREGVSFCHDISLLPPHPTTHPPQGWGKHCVPHNGLGGSSGCCCPPGTPPVSTQQVRMLGLETWLILLWKILSSTKHLAGLKGRVRLPYSTLLIRLSIYTSF